MNQDTFFRLGDQVLVEQINLPEAGVWKGVLLEKTPDSYNVGGRLFKKDEVRLSLDDRTYAALLQLADLLDSKGLIEQSNIVDQIIKAYIPTVWDDTKKEYVKVKRPEAFRPLPWEEREKAEKEKKEDLEQWKAEEKAIRDEKLRKTLNIPKEKLVEIYTRLYDWATDKLKATATIESQLVIFAGGEIGEIAGSTQVIEQLDTLINSLSKKIPLEEIKQWILKTFGVNVDELAKPEVKDASFETLLRLADDFDRKGLKEEANLIDEIIKEAWIKVPQPSVLKGGAAEKLYGELSSMYERTGEESRPPHPRQEGRAKALPPIPVYTPRATYTPDEIETIQLLMMQLREESSKLIDSLAEDEMAEQAKTKYKNELAATALADPIAAGIALLRQWDIFVGRFNTEGDQTYKQYQNDREWLKAIADRLGGESKLLPIYDSIEDASIAKEFISRCKIAIRALQNISMGKDKLGRGPEEVKSELYELLNELVGQQIVANWQKKKITASEVPTALDKAVEYIEAVVPGTFTPETIGIAARHYGVSEEDLRAALPEGHEGKKAEVFRELLRVADSLDSKGFKEEADLVDKLIREAYVFEYKCPKCGTTVESADVEKCPKCKEEMKKGHEVFEKK